MSSSASSERVPELLAPAGTPEAFDAVLEQGCDAVYFGLGAFNARGPAANLSARDLPHLLRRAAPRGVKLYLTLNTLLSDAELPDALALAALAHEQGVDALIVQDKGLALALRRYLPELALHGSTQMSLNSPEALCEARELGLRRVILPRELSAEEIREMVVVARSLELETEVFVHGALCVCASGQCGLSHYKGGRSANRGACAQACRLNYALEARGAAGRGRDDGPGPLLSPRDQALIEHLERLAELGVDSIKIEGRRRPAQYAAAATAAYRRALDALRGGEATEAAAQDLALRLAFNRGGAFTDHWFSDRRGPGFLTGNWPGHHGLRLGSVLECRAQSGELIFSLEGEAAGERAALRAHLRPGSVLALREERRAEEAASAPIGKISFRAGTALVRGFHPEVLRRLPRGLAVYLMSSAAQRLDLQARAQGGGKRSPVDWRLERAAQGDLSLSAQLGAQRVAVLLDEDAAYPALSAEAAAQALRKLGGSPFTAGRVEVGLAPRLPLSRLNAARRQLCAELEERLIAAKRRAPRSVRLTFEDFWAEAESDAEGRGEGPAAGPERAHAPAAEAGRDAGADGERRRLLYVRLACGRGAAGARERLRALAAQYDYVILPIEALSAEPAWFELLAEDRAGKYGLALPPLYGREQARAWRRALEKLDAAAGGPRRCFFSSCPGLKSWTGAFPRLRSAEDEGSHIMNTLAGLWALGQGRALLSFAEELPCAERLTLAENLAAAARAPGRGGPWPALLLTAGGERRSMYCRHCVLGMRGRGCSACAQAGETFLRAADGSAQRVVFHPAADCCMELLQPPGEALRDESAWLLSRRWPLPVVVRDNIYL